MFEAYRWNLIVTTALSIVLLAACTDSGSNDANSFEVGVTPGDASQTMDSLDGGRADTVPGHDGGEDVSDVETGDGDTDGDAEACGGTWETNLGEEKCCSKARVTCRMFNFRMDSLQGPTSYFAPQNDLLSIYYKRNYTKLESARLTATVKQESSGGTGSGRAISVEATTVPDGLQFDLSSYEYTNDEVVELGNLTVEDTCGHRREFDIRKTLDPHTESAQFEFGCKE